jgi:dTDP-glucose 4,6-dehydratase
VYDEAKRFAEALTVAFSRVRGVDAGIVRIFNTYGPRLRAGDGRVVSNLVTQALAGRPLTIYGDGSQTRSFCYVDDLVAGLCSVIGAAGLRGPVNLGNPGELTIRELAAEVLRVTGSSSPVVHEAPAPGDPTRRRPDISLARELLSWEPHVPLEEGLRRTVAWFAERGGGRRGIA